MSISLEELKERVPSVFKDASYGKPSERYMQINTSDVLSHFFDKGWEVQAATEMNVRTDARRGFQKHLVILKHEDYRIEDEGNLNVVIRNSHDQTNSLELFYGFMRVVCSNQLMVRNIGRAGDHSVFRHYKKNQEPIQNKINQVLNGFDNFIEEIRFLKAKELSPDKVKLFVRKAVGLRFGADFVIDQESIERSVLRVRRPEDQGFDSWKVLNRIQETFIKGLGRYIIPSVGQRKIKSLTSIDRLVSFNNDLWLLAKAI
ncbi:DUF932 domain-containing protein [Leptospira neocaledonica]|uniref:DUF932 domain-containing protein n=1 Tax=Leptospira neocaledonica TaxID=2023192 RepID=A0A2M9ZZU2_9LEPT|nr:DUF932 domain-containing protein [Leptospira neocaledonica]PJZ77433.1 hypothetical protein CH365_07555 [Leptospira neocaledonica]